LRQIDVWKNGKYDVIGTNTQYFGTSNVIPHLCLGEIPHGAFLRFNTIICSSLMMKKTDAVWRDHFVYDYDMWLRMETEKKKFYNCSEVLTLHRVHNQSFYNTSNNNHVSNLLKEWKMKRTVDSKTTIVTCYYKFPSKYSSKVYTEWINNFLEIPCKMVVFTDSESLPLIRSGREKYKEITTIIDLPMDKWEINTIVPKSYWKYCHQLDVENDIHTTKLYQVWAMKSWFVKRAIEMNPYGSDYYFWCDIGSVRDRKLVDGLYSFPRAETVFSLPKDRINLIVINAFQQSDLQINKATEIPLMYCNHMKDGKMISCPNIVRVQGGFFGGHVDAWPKWIEEYRETLIRFLRAGLFGGKDQYIMGTIAIVRNNLVNVIEAYNCDFGLWHHYMHRFS
jgi:hypothetical protein